MTYLKNLTLGLIIIGCLYGSARGQGATTFPTTVDDAFSLPAHSDNCATFLTSAITAIQTGAIGVGNAGCITADGAVIQIDNEMLYVVQIDGMTIEIVQRAWGNTLARPHASKATVRAVLSGGHINGIRGATLELERKQGTGADLPGGGREVLISDTANASVWRVLQALDLGSGTANSTKFLRGDLTWQPFTTGTVTSVDVTAASEFTVSGSPITSSGTIDISWSVQSMNKVFAGPASGLPGTPIFRTLVINDLPGSIPNSKLQNSSITVSGTTNQVNVSGSPVSLGGTVTLSLPQNIHTGASPTFDSVTLTNGSKQGGRSLIGSSSASYSSVGLEVRYGTSSNGDYAMKLCRDDGTLCYKFGRENQSTGHLVIEGSQAGVQAYRFKDGPILLDADNSQDIGQSASFRPRTVYVGTSVIAPLFSLGSGVGWSKAAGAPAGACTNGALYTNTTTGKLYVCEATAWVIK